MPVIVVLGVELVDVVAALALLLVAWAAAILLIRPLAYVLSHIPAIGQQIADALTNGATAVQNWALDWAKNAVGALVQVVSTVAYWIGQIWNTTVQVAEVVAQQILTSIQQILALSNRVSLGLSNLVDDIQSAIARIAAVAASIPTIAARLIADAVATVYATVRSWIVAAENALWRGIDAVRVELGHAIDGFTTALNQLELRLTHAIDLGIAGVKTWVIDVLRPIIQELAGVKVVTDAVVGAGVVPFVIEWATELPRIVDECVNPTCSGLNTSFDILNAVTDGVMIAAVMGIVAECVNDPQAGARTVAGIADALRGDIDVVLSPVGIHL